MALDAKTKKAQDDFVNARKALPAKVPEAAKKEFAALTAETDNWAAQLKTYVAAVEKALDHSKYDQKKKDLDKARDDVNEAVDLVSQIKSNAFAHPEALEKLASKVADKAGDLSIPLTKLIAAASSVASLKAPEKIP